MSHFSVPTCLLVALLLPAPAAGQPESDSGSPVPGCQDFRLSGDNESGCCEGTGDPALGLPVPEGVIHIDAVARTATGYAAFEGVYDRETGAEPLREWDATNIFVVGPDRTLTQITTSDAGFLPAWSPAGDQLAYSDDDSLWLYDSATTSRRQLVDGGPSDDPQHEWDYRSFVVPTWSPDGTLIAYFMTNGATADVRVVRVSDGAVLYQSEGETYGLAWGEGNRLLVFEDGRCTALVAERPF